jgi:hypothetical protein
VSAAFQLVTEFGEFAAAGHLTGELLEGGASSFTALSSLQAACREADCDVLREVLPSRRRQSAVPTGPQAGSSWPAAREALYSAFSSSPGG